MRIMTGKGQPDGTFQMQCIGESLDGETAKEAIKRVAERFLNHSLNEKKHHWHESYGRVGAHDSPTDYLPGLFVGFRLFTVGVGWDADKQEWVL